MDLIEKMKSFSDFIFAAGVSLVEIRSVEKLLDVTFAKEYEKYLSEFGVVAVNGHELTGICTSTRVHVASATMKYRERFPTVSQDWYVVEETNIDGIVIWQSETGEVYQTAPNMQPIKIGASLAEYLNL